MRRCDTGRLITRTNKKGCFYSIRLNFVEIDTNGKVSYKTKDISTPLPAKRKNKTAAEALLAETISKYTTNVYHMSFPDYCEKWLADKKPVLELTTYEGYQYRIAHIRAYWEARNVLVTNLKPQDIRDFYQWLLTTDVKKGNSIVHGYSNRSIKDTAVLLIAILEDAVNLEIIRKNPAANVKIPQKPVSRNQQAYISEDQVDAFKNEITGHRLEVPFLMALYFGLRREEILGLKWSCIRNGNLYIEHTVSRVKTTVAKDRVKTSAGYRSYPLLPEIQKKLDNLKNQQDFYRKQLGSKYQDSDYIFTWEDGHPYSPDYLSRSFKKLVRQSEVLDDSLTLHSLRASCVSILIHSGVDIKDTQVWVGHSDIATTMNVYARTNEKQQTAVANIMAQIVFSENS